MESAGRPLPRGVVTFLLTDIEGSTQLWDRDAQAMSNALARHDALIAAAVESSGGTLLKARGEGDSTFAVFERPTQAVAAALRAREDLGHENWTEECPIDVRFAIHAGEVSERDGDYYGTAVNRAARIRSAAVGGQILVSETVASVVADELPDGVSLTDLGKAELRGLTRPEHVWAVVDAHGSVRERLGGACPYLGLLNYEPEDSDLYFGRERVVDDVLARLAARRLVVVVGPSGSGKSSLVRAGVVAALRQSAALDGEAKSVHFVAIGPSPLEALQGTGVLDEESGSRSTVVVVDQMEDLFTACDDATARARFVDALLDAVESPRADVSLVGALRADFYGHCAGIPRLAAALSCATYLLAPLDEADLRRAIEGPAACAGLRLDPGLTDLVLRDLGHEPGSLPLLSHALLETWHRRKGRTMTVSGYREAGGVRGAIARTAEAVWDSLSAEQQRAARQLFLRLTELGEGTEDTRRRVPRAELESIRGAKTDDILGTLVNARLVTVDDHGVEVAHEALIREWPRLRGWLDDDRDLIRLHHHLTHAAHDWVALDRDSSELYRGPRLAAARVLVDESERSQVNEIEDQFLRASIAAEDEERHVAEERARSRERANRRLRALLAATSVALVVAAGAGILAWRQRNRADEQADRARDATVSAEVDRIVADFPRLLSENRELAGLLAVEANRLRPSPRTEGLLRAALLEEPRFDRTLRGGVGAYSWATSVPGHAEVLAAAKSGVDVWDLTTRAPARHVDLPGATVVVATANGDRVAVGTSDGTVTLWDAYLRDAPISTLHLPGPVADVAFAPDGTTIAVALGEQEKATPIGADTAPRLIDLASGHVVRELSGDTHVVNALAFTPDGLDVITASGNSVLVHDVATGSAVRLLATAGGPFANIAVNPEGTLIALGTDKGISVIDLATGGRVDLHGPTGRRLVDFTRDGGALLVIDGVGKVYEWRTPKVVFGSATAPGEPDMAIQTQHGPGTLAAFVDGAGLVTVGYDGTATVWQPNASFPASISRSIAGAAMGGGVFSPDDSTLVTVGFDDTAVVVRLTDLSPIATLSVRGPGTRDANAGATGAAFSHDGRVLALNSRDGFVQLFDGHTFTPLAGPIPVATKYLDQMSFNSDGRYLVAGSVDDDNSWVVDVNSRRAAPLSPAAPRAVGGSFSPDGQRLVVVAVGQGAFEYPVTATGVGTGHRVEQVPTDAVVAQFSPDGRTLAVSTLFGEVRLLDATTYIPLAPPIKSGSGIIPTIAFSPDGHFIAAQDQDENVRLVDVEHRAPAGSSIPGAGGFGYPNFSSDGRTLVLPHTGGSILLNLEVSASTTAICRATGRRLTQDEWSTYLAAAGPYTPGC